MLISLDANDPRPIYVQLMSQLKEQVVRGTLRPGDELPSVRELAATLEINLHTVHRAYQKLRDEGVIRLRLGRRAQVAEQREQPASPEEIASRLTSRLDELITDATHLGLTPADFRGLVDTRLRAKGNVNRRRS